MAIQAYSAFENQVNTLLTGSVAVKVLKVVLAHPDDFIEVCHTFKSDLVPNLSSVGWTQESMTDHLKRVLAQRQQELELFQRYCEWASDFKALCRDMEGV